MIHRDSGLSRNKKTPGNYCLPEHAEASYDPYGTRTRVAGVKGRSPRPLDEGAVYSFSVKFDPID